MKEWIYILLMMVFASCSNDDYPTVQPDSRANGQPRMENLLTGQYIMAIWNG